MIKPIAISSVIPLLGLFSYWTNHRMDLLQTSLLLYIGLVTGNVVKYFLSNKSKV
jgi:hypothetical protein